MRLPKPLRALLARRRLQNRKWVHPMAAEKIRAGRTVWRNATQAEKTGAVESHKLGSRIRRAGALIVAKLGLDRAGVLDRRKRWRVTWATVRLYNQLERLRREIGNLEFGLNSLSFAPNSKSLADAALEKFKQIPLEQRQGQVWQRDWVNRLVRYGANRLDAEQLIERHTRAQLQLQELLRAPPEVIKKQLGKKRVRRFWSAVQEAELILN